MIYRNQITEPNQFSLNPVINKERKQKYKLHLNKIFQIQNRQIKSKSKQSVKKVEQKIIQLTKLKQFSRNFKTKEQTFQRVRNDIIMLHHINERLKTNPKQQSLRKTKSSLKFNSRMISTQRNLKSGQITEQIRHENRRLMKSITQNSFDQNKFRQTLKCTTKKYLKVRDHMRRIKTNQESLKRLNSSSLNRSNTTKFLQSTANQQNASDENVKYEQKILNLEKNKSRIQINSEIKNAIHSSTTSIFRPKQSKNKFKIKDNITTEIMLKKLKNLQ